MSVRAYRIIKKVLEDNSSFNLWHDEKLVDYLQDETCFYNLLGDDGSGTSYLSVKDIKKIISKKKELKLDDETVSQLEKDIEGLSEDDDIEYDCY